MLLANAYIKPGGRIPAWLLRTTDFAATGLKSGSTCLEFRAPILGSVATRQFEYKDLFAPNVSVNLDDSAVDLSCKAIQDALDGDSDGNRYDDQVLEAVLRFARIASVQGVTLSMSSLDDEDIAIKLEQGNFERLLERKDQLPRPSMQIVSGVLDQIRHSSLSFELKINGKYKLLGHLDDHHLDTESMRLLWGKQTTVVGLVHYKRNGMPRVIEAHQILPYREGDKFFRQVPSLKRDPFLDDKKRSGSSPYTRFDPLSLSESWPGEESFQELLNELRSL